MRWLKIAALLVVAGLVFFLIRYIDWSSSPVPLEPGAIAGIRRNLHPFGTVEPGGPSDELQFLKPILRNKRIVAVGEAAVGVHQTLAMKQRLFQFLVEEMDFRTLAFDAGAGQCAASPFDEVEELRRWVREYNTPIKVECTQAGDVSKLPGRVFFWTTNKHLPEVRRTSSEAYAIAFEFSEGSFRAPDRAGELTVYTVDAAPPEYYANAFARTGSLVFFLDFDAMRSDSALGGWLMQPQWSHCYGRHYWLTRHLRKLNSIKAALPDLYDGLVFVRQAAAAFPVGQRPRPQ